jgi:hypothetical protein
VSLILQLSFDDVPAPPPPAPEEMDSDTAARYMYERFTSQWGAAPDRLDNESFDARLVLPGASWIDFQVAPVTSRQATLGQPGNQKWYRQDLLVITVASPTDRGLGPAMRLAAQVRGIFEGFRNGGLYVTNPTVRRQGNDGQWFRVVVDVPFNYHELK